LKKEIGPVLFLVALPTIIPKYITIPCYLNVHFVGLWKCWIH